MATGVNCTAAEAQLNITGLFDSPNDLRTKANTIHVVFGSFLIAKCVVWSCFTTRMSPGMFLFWMPKSCARLCLPTCLLRRLSKPILISIPSVFAGSAVLFTLSGLYLLLMVFVFLRQDRLQQLWYFALHDITQLQHIAISVCLMGQGASEGMFAYMHQLTRLSVDSTVRQSVHVVSFINGAMVAMLFTVHPQKSDDMTSLHITLGASLFFGHFFWFLLKLMNFRSRGSGMLEVIAGLNYGVACQALFSYDEPGSSHSHLHGIRAVCSPSFGLTLFGIATGISSCVVSYCSICYVRFFASSRTRRRARPQASKFKPAKKRVFAPLP